MTAADEILRRLTVSDVDLLTAIADPDRRGPPIHRLDERTECLLRLGALVALDAPQASYQAAVGAAERAGGQPEDYVGVLAAIAGLVGSAKVVAAAPRIALAAGYDVDAALEGSGTSDHSA